ncbi:MAG: class I SAM-dependent methyltransferase [Candidatus Altiarchaeota archaeon]
MPEKIVPDNITGVGRTLFTPLKYRALYSKSSDNGYEDAIAEKFYESIDYPWGPINHKPSLWGVVVRTEILDAFCSSYLSQNPGATVVNLGAGLCTRFHRLGQPDANWIEVDLPEVIEFRKLLGEPSNPRHMFFKATLPDERLYSYLTSLSSSKYLFIAEALLMIFSEMDVRQMFNKFLNLPADSDIVFDAASPLLTSYKNIFSGSRYSWGLWDSRSLESWGDNITLVDEWCYGGRHPELLDILRRTLFQAPLLNSMLKIVHVKNR